MDKKKIKPCPFCGAKAEYSDEMGAILCEGCGFYFECPTTLEQALETWNMRGGEIITPKVKVRRVELKGRVTVVDGRLTAISYQTVERLMYAIALTRTADIPVTITIEEKWLKEGKV